MQHYFRTECNTILGQQVKFFRSRATLFKESLLHYFMTFLGQRAKLFQDSVQHLIMVAMSQRWKKVPKKELKQIKALFKVLEKSTKKINTK